MKINWRDWQKRNIPNIPIDDLVGQIAGLGIPGLVFIVAMMLNPFYGGAAIVTALAALGGPFGMLVGIGTVVVLGFIAAAISKFGFEEIFKGVLRKLKEQGKTKEEILKEINSYPISKKLKLKLRDEIKNIESEETDGCGATGSSELSGRRQGIFSRNRRLVDTDLEQFESRLNKKIDDVRGDLNNSRTYANCVKQQYISLKKSLFQLFNPLNPPYQGDFKRKCVSPK